MNFNTTELGIRDWSLPCVLWKAASVNMVRVITEDYNEKDHTTWGKDTVCHIKDIRTDEDGYMYILVDVDKFGE